MRPTLKWQALEKENHECTAAYHMYQPDVTYFELKPRRSYMTKYGVETAYDWQKDTTGLDAIW